MCELLHLYVVSRCNLNTEYTVTMYIYIMFPGTVTPGVKFSHC